MALNRNYFVGGFLAIALSFCSGWAMDKDQRVSEHILANRDLWVSVFSKFKGVEFVAFRSVCKAWQNCLQNDTVAQLFGLAMPYQGRDYIIKNAATYNADVLRWLCSLLISDERASIIAGMESGSIALTPNLISAVLQSGTLSEHTDLTCLLDMLLTIRYGSPPKDDIYDDTRRYYKTDIEKKYDHCICLLSKKAFTVTSSKTRLMSIVVTCADAKNIDELKRILSNNRHMFTDSNFLDGILHRLLPHNVFQIFKDLDITLIQSDEKGQSLLHKWLREGYVPGVQKSLESGHVDINHTDTKGNTPLVYLVKQIGTYDPSANRNLHKWTINQQLRCIDILLSHNADPSVLLQPWCGHDQDAYIGCLCDWSAQTCDESELIATDYEGENQLQKYPQISIIFLSHLIDRLSDTAAAYSSILSQWFVQKPVSSFHFLSKFLKYKNFFTWIDNNGDTCWHYAVRAQRYDFVTWVDTLKFDHKDTAKACLNVINHEGKTALDYIDPSCSDMLEWLLCNGGLYGADLQNS